MMMIINDYGNDNRHDDIYKRYDDDDDNGDDNDNR